MLRTYFWKENNILFLYTFRQYSFRNKHDNEWIEEKRSKLITFTCIFFQDTRHGHHIITLLYMFPFFPISTLKSTLRVWPVSIGCSMPHTTLSYPYFFFQVRVCFLMQMFSIFLWTFHCGHSLLLPHVLHLKTRWFIISNT